MLNAVTMALAGEGIPSFKKYAFTEGLYVSAVNDLARDQFGFIWLATEDGLVRFDGTDFKVYKRGVTGLHGSRRNHISSLYNDPDGVLWMGTDGGGLGYYEHRNDSIYSFQPSNGPYAISSAITSVVGGWDGNIWVSAYGGLYVIDPISMAVRNDGAYGLMNDEFDGKVLFSIFHDSKNRSWIGTDDGLFLYDASFELAAVFEMNSVTNIAEDNDGRIWVGNRAGLHTLTPAESPHQFTVERVTALAGLTVNAIAFAPSGKLWVGTNDGLFVLGVDDGQEMRYLPDDQNPNSLGSKFISSILIDPAGTYWVGTFRGGLNKYDVNENNFRSLRCPLVTSFAAYDDEILVGTDGNGLYTYNRKSSSLARVYLPFTGAGKADKLSVLAMESTAVGQVYLGTFDSGLLVYDVRSETIRTYKKGDTPYDLSHSSIFCLKKDRKGNIWVGTNGGGVNMLNVGTGIIEKFVNNAGTVEGLAQLSSNYIRALEEDGEGKIWIGTYGAGISVYDPDKRVFKVLNVANSGLPSDYVHSIYADPKGNIWVGTDSNGLGLMTAGSEKFVTLSEDRGLANTIVWKILADSQGKIWLSTNRGISCYYPELGSFKNYSHRGDGLQPGAFGLGAGICMPDGELFFGGQYGFNHFVPTKLRKDVRTPEVVLTELRIDNTVVGPSDDGPIDRAILLAERIKLAYGQNFSISFKGLNYTASEKNVYEYWLEGFDQNWKQPGTEHTAHYTNLNPGNYVFNVRARNNDGVWSERARRVVIQVAPPLWRTPAAYAMYAVLAISLLVFLGHHHARRVQLKFELDKERFIAKQQLEQQQKQAAHSRQLDRLKIKFLTNLSHELRTPISLIIGSCGNLISEGGSGKIMESLSLIRRNAKHVLNLVNQLLDFRKMEEQELKLALQEGDIVSFLEEVCESFNDEAKRRHLQYEIKVTTNVDPVWFDHGKVERILINLLSNAFKFTPDGGTISVNMKKLDSSDCDRLLFEVSVEDSGMGIAPELHEKIFLRLFHKDADEGNVNRGTGIGLSIVREFVKMHGGTIWLESEPGQGSRFTFTLALHVSGAIQEVPIDVGLRSAQLADEPDGMTVPDSPADKPLLLIVEDDDDFRFYLKDNLKNQFRVQEATNGMEGWQRALFHHPDVIVCDVNMPFMNGIEFVQKITTDKRTQHIPTILLTAAKVDLVQLTGLASGAVDCMDKSFDFAVLQAKINNLLSLSKVFKDTYSKRLSVALPEQQIIPEREKFILSVKSFIRENIANPQLSVETVSEHLAISRASLYNRLLEFSGLTPIQFIRSIKLDYAASLLEQSEMTVSEVAYEAGFQNPNYFTKVFKSHFEMTPSEFTKRKNKSAPAEI